MTPKHEKQEFVTVLVRDPRTQKEDSWHSYIDYEIFIHTNSMCFTRKTSCVRRRFREFVWLRQRLQSNAVLIQLPELPSKTPFFNMNNPHHVDHRRQGLQEFLEKEELARNKVRTYRAFVKPLYAEHGSNSYQHGQHLDAKAKHWTSVKSGNGCPILIWLYCINAGILQDALLLSDSRLHLFLQTQLSPEDIEACVSGQTKYSVADAIHKFASLNRRFPIEDEERKKGRNDMDSDSESSSSGLGPSDDSISCGCKPSPASEES